MATKAFEQQTVAERGREVVKATLVRMIPNETEQAWAKLAKTLCQQITPDEIISMVDRFADLAEELYMRHTWTHARTLAFCTQHFTDALALTERQVANGSSYNRTDTQTQALDHLFRFARTKAEYDEIALDFSVQRQRTQSAQKNAYGGPVGKVAGGYATNEEAEPAVRVAAVKHW